ncbi:MAG: DMT family transporter [Gammaproteobacteria bacterium]|nr:DMT family transporter [Gammaproteobacteria bacterium]MDH3448678.1 DMT family transporter [Gammaproteobacteria bacterium]
MIENNATARAMVMMIAAMLMLPGIDAIAKWLSGSVSSGQVTWSRFFFQIILMSPLLLRTRGPWLTPALLLHAARGSLIAFATLFFFSGLAHLPLADAIAIFFIEPLLVTLLSALFFGEAIHWRRISAIALGFAGALIIIRPTFSEVGYAVLYPVAAACCFAFYIVLTRQLVRHEDPIRLQFFAGIFGCLVMSIALAWGTAGHIAILSVNWPTTSQWLLLALLGLIATVCHLMVVYAYRLASIGILAPFQYVEIIGATILGLIIFGDFPDPITWVGVSIIVGSGMYVFNREAKLARQPGR